MRSLIISILILNVIIGGCSNVPSVAIKSVKDDMIDAVKSNNTSRLVELFKLQQNINFRDRNGSTLLMIAAGLGHYDASKLIVECDADIHQVDSMMGVTALHRAAQSGNVQIIKMLLNKGAFIDGQSFVNGHTPLLDAAFYKRYDAMELLLKSGSNLKLKNTLGLTVMDWGKRQKDKRIINLVKQQLERDKNLEKEQKLMAAVKANNIKLVKKLIENGSNVNQIAKDGNTPLLWVSKYGYTEIAKLLLENGANPNVVDRLMKATPGHKAAFFGHTQIIKLLVKHGLNLDAIGPYNGYTALHDAILNSHIEASKSLIKAGARFDIPGIDGKTSFQLATDLKLNGLIALMER